jgi:hypothetical protein
VLAPAWVLMWLAVGALTAPWRRVLLYSTGWSWIPAGLVFGAVFWIYRLAGGPFNWAQLAGLP